MRHSDLHTHTVFSDGANTMEEMVLGAIERGLASIGFSDHSYTAHDLSYCMGKERLPEYHAEIRRLRALYGDRVEVYAGLECDGCTELEDRHLYDYLIGDCHYVKTRDGYHTVDHSKEEQRLAVETYFSGDTAAYCRAYFEGYVEAAQRHRPDVLGHFDLPVKFGFVDEEATAYRNWAADALAACLEVTPIVEVNTGAIARGFQTKPYPAFFLLRRLLELGGKVTLCSDAHRPEHLGFRFGDAMELLKATGFDSVMVFRNRKFQETGI